MVSRATVVEMRPLWRGQRALDSAAHGKPLPPEVVDLDDFRNRKQNRLGGVIHEYQWAA